MPLANVRGVKINYEVLGNGGPWVALSPGGRRDLEGVKSLATRLADAGHRVLVHDRRNCGASDVVIDGNDSEYEIWADDLYALLSQLGALPAFIGGSSSGCRLSLLFALRHPGAARGLLLWRVTGGPLAAQRLAERYYGQYIEAVKRGGMAVVCEMEDFKERIEVRPENRDALMKMDPERFTAVMSHWREYFIRGADLPVIGATEAELKSIAVPACIVPGNDKTHPRHVGENLSRLLPNGEVHHLMTKYHDLDLGPREEWDEKESEMAAIFGEFLNRVAAPRAA
ncbi:MAG: alpha/beta hydrolase [Deltaproteobacteria bacterium]|nr:alpha/beta hydrolase [Deltaproteobacteria bacterium]MBI2999617.1 alpha/beta hydrolase [Deltaproteobacteria bacterium]